MGAWAWVKRWLTTTNHKDIGILYMVTSIYFFLVAGVLATLFRTQLAFPDKEILVGSEFNQAVTIHGLLMLLWFMSPFEVGLANYLVPLQIGARDLAFPRLNALSYWLYLASGLVLIAGFFVPGGAADMGWTLYAPQNVLLTGDGTILAAVAIILITASVTVGTVNFVVTIAKLRAPGMTWSRIPMFTWGVLFSVLMMWLAFPPLAVGALALILDKMLGTTFLTSLEGGALLWDHLFWFFGHPEVYVLLLPALGAMADIVSVFARRQLYARRFVIISLFIATALSYLVWMHHMFITGTSLTVRKIFSVTTALISIPFELATLALIMTLYKGRVLYRAPLLYVIVGIIFFIIGGSTGVFQAAIILDRAFRGTYWVVAHFHYIMVGAVLLGLLGALYFWWPKITGRLYNEKLAKIQLLLLGVGVTATYLPQFLLIDMPRRYYTYPEEWLGLNRISTLGPYILLVAFLLGLYILLDSLVRGKPAPPNPWKAWGLEWAVPSPPPRHNYDGQPVVREDGSIVFVPEHELERIGVENVMKSSDNLELAPKGMLPNGEAGLKHTHHEHWSMTPMIAGLSTLVMGIGLVVGKPILLLGLAMLAAAIVKWAIDDYRERFHEDEPRFREDWPFSGTNKLRLGMWTFISSEVFLFGSLISVYLFIRSRSLAWPPGYEYHDPYIGLLNTIILFTGTLFYSLAYLYAKHGEMIKSAALMLGTIATGGLFLGVKAFEWWELFAEGYGITSNLPIQLYFVLTGIHALHVIVGILATLYMVVKILTGRKPSLTSILMLGIYWGIVEIVWTFLFPMFYLM